MQILQVWIHHIKQIRVECYEDCQTQHNIHEDLDSLTSIDSSFPTILFTSHSIIVQPGGGGQNFTNVNRNHKQLGGIFMIENTVYFCIGATLLKLFAASLVTVNSSSRISFSSGGNDAIGSFSPLELPRENSRIAFHLINLFELDFQLRDIYCGSDATLRDRAASGSCESGANCVASSRAFMAQAHLQSAAKLYIHPVNSWFQLSNSGAA